MKFGEKKRRVLTDFNLPRWNGTNMLSVRDRVNLFKNQELMGELFHPREDHMHEIINKDRVVIKITNIKIENNCVYGDVECILDTELGKKAQEIFENNGRLSIRANNSGGKFTKIITWDVVNG